jgi:hypothetical protein
MHIAGRGRATPKKSRFATGFCRHFSLRPSVVIEIGSTPRLHLSAWRRQRRDLPKYTGRVELAEH